MEPFNCSYVVKEIENANHQSNESFKIYLTMAANFAKQDMKTKSLTKINNLVFTKQGTSNVETKKIFSVIVKRTSIRQQGRSNLP